MNKRKTFIYTIIFILLFSMITTYSHSGRTDSDGGHYVSSTGDYHYHHRYSAHQHKNGECPYESIWRYIAPILLLVAIGLVWFMWWKISLSLPNVVTSNLENAVLNYKNAIHYVDFCNKELKEIKEKSIIPNGYEIGNDGLPKEINCTDWGKSLTLYTVLDGWKLHIDKDCCDSLFAYKRNIYRFYNKRYSICKKCATNYKPPNMEWYTEYLKIAPQNNKCKQAKDKYYTALRIMDECYSDSNTKIAKFLLFFSTTYTRKFNKLKNEYIKLKSTLDK